MSPVATKTRPTSNGKTFFAKEPKVTIETVTPAMAKEWLEGNIENRTLRESRVRMLIGILQRGEWVLSPDAIAFDTEGILRNGQHRLTAIMGARKSAPNIVLRGIPAHAQEIMDRGLPRSAADALKMRGHKNVFVLAAALNWLFRLDYIAETGNVHYSHGGERPTTAQLLKVLELNPEIIDYIRLATPVSKELKTRTALTAALYYGMALIDADEADVFFGKLLTGAELKANDPIFQLRRMLISDATSVSRMPDYRQAAIIAKAWNLWREGKPVQSLAWKFGGSQKEAFPVLK